MAKQKVNKSALVREILTPTPEMIREVKALVVKAGGYEKLKELVDALAE